MLSPSTVAVSLVSLASVRAYKSVKPTKFLLAVDYLYFR